MPYLAMIDRLRAFLRQPTATLILCGYSFRDEHINEVIVQGLQSTQTAIGFSLLFGKIADYPQAVKLACERPNLSLLARDGAVISGRQASWPEKEAASVPTGNGVAWKPVKAGDEKANKQAEFLLGDFAEFGKFLRELVGQVRRSAETTSA